MPFRDYDRCVLCPRACGAERNAGNMGFCGETAELKIASIGPHFGEEPPISGTKGSGTIFYSGCSTGCFFCQNYQISRDHTGTVYTPAAFLQAMLALAGRGVHNINHVTPDHFWPHICEHILQLKKEGCALPHLINSSGYQTEATARDMADHAEIFLPDFKFADPELARLCMGRTDYPETAIKAIEIWVEARGFLDADFSGKERSFQPAASGVMVRHLVLPGHADNSIQALEMLRAKFGPFLPVSLMSQYMPTLHCRGKNEFSRGVSADEYEQVLEAADRLGFENLFCQELEQNAAFFPDFNDPEPFDGNRNRNSI
ncbi:MAG: radical SAM protein [Fibrobacterota bacterium]